MNKSCIVFFIAFLGLATQAFSQTNDTTLYYLGKWEITILGTPNGDAKMIAEISRVDGKLVGDLTNPLSLNHQKIQ